MASSAVKFCYVNHKADLPAELQKYTIYFVQDTNQIYVGSNLIADRSAFVVTATGSDEDGYTTNYTAQQIKDRIDLGQFPVMLVQWQDSFADVATVSGLNTLTGNTYPVFSSIGVDTDDKVSVRVYRFTEASKLKVIIPDFVNQDTPEPVDTTVSGYFEVDLDEESVIAHIDQAEVIAALTPSTMKPVNIIIQVSKEEWGETRILQANPYLTSSGTTKLHVVSLEYLIDDDLIKIHLDPTDEGWTVKEDIMSDNTKWDIEGDDEPEIEQESPSL